MPSTANQCGGGGGGAGGSGFNGGLGPSEKAGDGGSGTNTLIVHGTLQQEQVMVVL